MKIPVTLQPLLTPLQREIPSLLKQLQVGQVLPARVLAQLQPDLAKLQLASTELLARTPMPLRAGTQLRLEVIKGQPLPELRILREPTPGELRHQLVRSALARQLPPGEVREARNTLRDQATTPRLADALQRFDGINRSAGVSAERLTPVQLQRALSNSGMFHEARLGAGNTPLQGDMKAQLIKLLTLLGSDAANAGKRPAAPPPDGQQPAGARDAGADSLLNRLIRLVEGSLARIQLQQSAALPLDDTSRQAWQFDLPVHLPDGTDDVKLRIERDAAGDDGDGAPAWAVNLVFEFESIGTLQCRIGLSGERVATTFWCAAEQTQARVEQRLPVLRDALEAQGLEVVHLAGVLGEPAEPLIRVPVPESLLDERA